VTISPRVSVIIPTYNRPGLLRETLTSVAAQTFRDFEIIVVDDGSTVPGVNDVCQGFLQCRYFHQENAGRSAARNRGIAAATGDYVAFVDDDDLWKPEKLDRQVCFLDMHPDIGLVHGPVEVIDENGKSIGERMMATHPDWYSGDVFRYLLVGCVVASPTPLMRRGVFDRCGLFDCNLNSSEDHEMWIRIAYKYSFGYIPEVLAYYRVHGGTTTLADSYLGSYPYIANKLAHWVARKDRYTVRHGVCRGYLARILSETPPLSWLRMRHLLHVISVFPPCVMTTKFRDVLLQGCRSHLAQLWARQRTA